MSKLKYLIEQSSTPLTTEQAQILIDLCGKGYVECSNENADYLVEQNLLFRSENKVIVSDLGDELLESSAVKYLEEQAPDKLERKVKRKPREISAELTEMCEYAKTIIEQEFDVKEVVTYCSNYHIKLKKRTLGIRQFELTNLNEFRVFGYKVSDEIIAKMQSIGAKIKIGGNNAYIDITLSKENIILVINTLVGK